MCVKVKSVKDGGVAPVMSRSLEPMGEGVTAAGSLVNSAAMLRVSAASLTTGRQGGTISTRSSAAQSMPRKKGWRLISAPPP